MLTRLRRPGVIVLPIADNIYLQRLALLVLLLVVIWLLTNLANYLRASAKAQRSMVDRVNRLLPQTQCGQCGYKGCRPYASAIIKGTAINQCPPGGTHTILRLANLLNEFPQALNPSHGENQPFAIAVIREDECIGCTKCIQACPVDAILGGPKLMHTIIEKECSGCDLCVEPCPVDCIDMVVSMKNDGWRWTLPSQLSSTDTMSKSVA
jgi:electron transport complex protein RnfB